MLTDEIAAYARNILDDPNTVFLPNSLLATFLQRGYNEFRRMLPREAREIRYAPAALVNVQDLNLDGVLFGSPATQARCQEMTRVQSIDPGTGRIRQLYQPVSAFQSLGQATGWGNSTAFTGNAMTWWLDRRTLRFGAPVTATIEIYYLPDDAGAFTTANIVPGAGSYLDDFDQWHEIIALLSAQHYAMKDGALSAPIQTRLADLRMQIQQHYAETRSGEGSRYVRDDYSGW